MTRTFIVVIGLMLLTGCYTTRSPNSISGMTAEELCMELQGKPCEEPENYR